MNSIQYDAVFKTPIARMGIRMSGCSVTDLVWLKDNSPLTESKNQKIYQVQLAIANYLINDNPLPRIKMKLTGTEFQLKVWRELQKIKLGNIVTYGELAKQLNTGSQAIGQACRTNPVVLFIPCHRVISASGSGGYMGKQNRTNIKTWLLKHERADV